VPSWNHQRSLKDWMSCHIARAQLGAPWSTTVATSYAPLNREPQYPRTGGHFCRSSVDGQILLLPSLCTICNHFHGRVNISLSHTQTHTYKHLFLLSQRVLFLSLRASSPVHMHRAIFGGNEYKCPHTFSNCGSIYYY